MKLKPKTFKGSTTSSYDDNKIIIHLSKVSKLTMLLTNTGNTNSIYYKVFTYADRNSDNYTTYTSETSLTSGNTNEEIISNTAYDKVEVYIKNNSGISKYELSVIKK